MNKIQDLAHAIDNGRTWRPGSMLVTPDGDVFSYNVCIFRCVNRKFHGKKYSNTTTRHQNLLRKALTHAGIKFTETENSLGQKAATKPVLHKMD